MGNTAAWQQSKKPMRYITVLILWVTGLANSNAQAKICLFTGTYTDGKPGKGIYAYSMQPETGVLTLAGTGEDITNPSFLAVSPNGQYLYACTDTKTLVPGNIRSFAIDTTTCAIRYINQQSSMGANPVYITVHKSNHFVMAANYTAGSAVVFGTNADGSINPALQTISFTGSSINKERQEKPHIHSVVFSPANDWVFMPDLGADKIHAFQFNPANAAPLTETDSLTVGTVPGSGPRHLVFHPQKNYAYCIEEMSGMVTAYAYKAGKLSLLQRIPSCRQKAEAHSSADIHLSPDGLFLYASNRIENTISIFSVAANGYIRLVGHQSTEGDVPRNFTLDPRGHFLLVANQGSNNIVVLKRNKKTGLLRDTGICVSVASPSCLQMRNYGY